MNTDKFIDIDKIFRERNPKLYKWIPRFLMNYIKKILHQEDLNRFQAANKNVYEYDYLAASIAEIGSNITYEGLDNVPEKESIIMAANHPLGGADGLAIMHVVSQKRKDIRFIVNDLLSNLKNFGSLFFGVNKLGNTVTQQLKQVDETYSQQNAVLIFPAGFVSRKIEGKIQDLPWNKSFVSKSIKYNKPIIPVHVRGQLSGFFYKLYLLRKFLRLKANIEMFYLVDEMYKQKNKSVHIKIGQPISVELLKTKYNAKEWCEIIRKYIYAMENSNVSFEKFLSEHQL